MRQRVIGIVAHIDAGKTTVTEHLLHLGGVVRRPGSVEHGTTVTDWMQEEQERGITIASAAIDFSWRDVRVTVVDTPGHIDFTIEVERALRVLDGVVLVVSGPDAVQAQTETVWQMVSRRKIPTIVLVNKIDRPGFDRDHVLAMLAERLGVTAVPFTWPIEAHESAIEVLDFLHDRVTRWTPGDDGTWDSETRTIGAIEDPLHADLMRGRERVTDAIANHDDAFLAEAIAGVPASPETAWRAARKATLAPAIVPVIWGAARHGVELETLADLIVALLPTYAETDPPIVFDRDPETAPRSLPADSDREGGPDTVAFVFKTERRRRHRLVFVRVLRGRLESRRALIRASDRKTWPGVDLARVMGQDYETIATLEAGDVGAIVFPLDVEVPLTGDTLGHVPLAFTCEPIVPPDAVIETTIEASDPAAHEHLTRAIQALVGDDPSLCLRTDPETGAHVIGGLGELHLEVAVDQLARTLGHRPAVGRPRVRRARLTAREGRAEATRVSTDGRGDVTIEVVVAALERAPSDREALIQISASLARADWRAAIISGVQAAAGVDGQSIAPLLGATIDVRRIASRGGDGVPPALFRDAALHATLQALADAGTGDAEPWGRLTTLCPEVAVGRVVGDLARRHAKIRRTEVLGKTHEIQAEAPLAELIGFASDLRTMTAGRGRFSLEPLGFRRVRAPHESP